MRREDYSKPFLRRLRDGARLSFVRAASSTRLPSGRTVTEVLLNDHLPRFVQSSDGERQKLCRQIAGGLMPGAQWLVDVVHATLRHWLSPNCPSSHYSRLAMPRRADFLASLEDKPPDKKEWNRVLDEFEEKHFARIEKRGRGQRGAEQPNATHPQKTRRRSPRPLTDRDARILADYQFGRATLSELASQHNLSRQRVHTIVARASRIVGLTLRPKPRGGRPRLGNSAIR